MSTSLGTSPKASPSSKERAAALWSAAYVSIVAVLFIALCEFPWRSISGQLREERAVAESAAPLVEQAKLWPMTYDTAEAGKPVVWCVDHPSQEVTYLNGDPGQPLVFSNGYPVPLNVGGSGGRCANVLAVVEGREARGLKLRFVQQL